MTALERVKRAQAELAKAELELAREEEKVVYPDGFRVEIRRDSWDPGYWELRYSNGDGTYSLGLGVRTGHTYDHVRIPEPPDGWEQARIDGKTHIVYLKNGGVFTTRTPDQHSHTRGVWTVVPIPPEEN